nr:hypothetical protein [Tanacetum cinerariifolium]
MLVESEARVAQEAWALSLGCSRVVHNELQAYQTHTQIQDTRISSVKELVMSLVSHTTSLQTQLIATMRRIDTLEAREPTYTDDSKDADSCKKSSKKRNQNQNHPRHCYYHCHHPMTDATIRALIAQGVADALAERIIQRNTNLNGDGCQGYRSGTEGVVGLTQWFERMEFVFHISNCTVENQVKFATCTIHRIALTWWNTHVKKELALLCGRMFLDEFDKVEKYFGGLLDMIQESVMASKPKEM